MSGFVYFASPMCSWCWGFSPCIDEIKQDYENESIQLVLTPFRVDTTEPMDDQLRNYVLGQWQKVHAVTSQPINFDFNVPKNFIYNTTLVAKAIKAFSKQRSAQELDYLKALQFAFYARNQNITDQNILLKLMESFAIDIDLAEQSLLSREITNELHQDFELCQQLNIQSYPTLMYAKKNEYILLSSGYMPYAELKPRIVAILEK